MVSLSVMKKQLKLLVVVTLLAASLANNDTATTSKPNALHKHYLVDRFAWHSLSGIGLIGTLANSLLLHTFLTVPNMATSVNCMITMDTAYRMIYSTVSIHWRTYIMSFTNEQADREKARDTYFLTMEILVQITLYTLYRFYFECFSYLFP